LKKLCGKPFLKYWLPREALSTSVDLRKPDFQLPWRDPGGDGQLPWWDPGGDGQLPWRDLGGDCQLPWRDPGGDGHQNARLNVWDRSPFLCKILATSFQHFQSRCIANRLKTRQLPTHLRSAGFMMAEMITVSASHSWRCIVVCTEQTGVTVAAAR